MAGPRVLADAGVHGSATDGRTDRRRVRPSRRHPLGGVGRTTHIIAPRAGEGGCPLFARLGGPRAAGRARTRPDRGRGARQPAGVAGVAPWAHAGPARGRLRHTGRRLLDDAHRAHLPAPRGIAAPRHPTVVADRGRGTGRRDESALAGRWSVGRQPRSSRPGRGGGADRLRRPDPLPPPIGALRDLPLRRARRPADGAPGPRRGHRSEHRSRPPGLARGPRRHRPR